MMDIVTNNLNSVASVYINKTDASKSNYLKIKLEYEGLNTFGIGTKVISYAKGQKQFKELQTTRDFNHQSQ
jgi:hypothetical protein